LRRLQKGKRENEAAENEEDDDGDAAVHQVAERRIVEFPIVPVMPRCKIIRMMQDNDERCNAPDNVELVKARFLHATHSP
jgi:hypothetical protein